MFFSEYIYSVEQNTMKIFTASCSQPKTLLHTLTFKDQLDQHARHIVASDYYLCGSDTYQGVYEFEENTIRIHYQITGPKKNYIIETVLTR